MTVADTGVLLALLDARHARHAEAKALLELGNITVTPPTLTEATRVIRRHAIQEGKDGNRLARMAFRILRSLPGFRVAPPPDEAAVAEAYDRDRALGYADAWNLLVSIEQSEALGTFDKHLRREYGRTHRNRR